jgi:hypothetical protein
MRQQIIKMEKTMKRITKGSTGALFPNTNKKNPKAPSLMGTLAFDRQLFEDLMNIYEETGDVAIQVSAWKNFAAETGDAFLTLKAQLPWEHRTQHTPPDDPSAYQFLAELD